MVAQNFLSVMFTEVTLFHILIILGLPYFILYFFHKKTKFDSFPEKWELGLFVFTVGGLIMLLSLKFQLWSKVNFYLIYLYGILGLSYLLFFIKKVYYKKEKPKKSDWVLVKLKNGDRFKGILEIKDRFYLRLKRSNKEKICKIVDDIDKELDWESIYLNYKEVLGVYFFNPGR